MSSHLSDEISSKLQGTAKVALDSLSFDPLDQPDRDNVERLVKMFRIEGCNRLNPLHFVSGTVSADVLQTSLAYSNLTADDLRAPTPPTLRLPPGALIECLHGKHRVTALRESKCFYPWWPVRLLTTSGADIAKKLYNRDTLGSALRIVLEIPGQRKGFKLGVWNIIVPERCDEEIVHYLQLIYDTFVFIMGSEDALKFVDDEGVQELELRAPGMSIRDDLHTADAIRKTRILRGLDDEPAREQVIRRLAKVEYLIPTVHTLQRDFYYLKQCTGVMKRLIAGKRRLPVTVQSLAWNAYTPNTASPFDTESEFLGRLKRLYLHIMQDVVELSGENPLMEEDEEKPEHREPVARRCGRQFSRAYAHDRHFLTPYWFTCKTQKSADITSLFVRRSVFHAFWGFHDNPEEEPREDDMPDIPEDDSVIGDPHQSTKPSVPTVPEDDEMRDAPAFSRSGQRKRPRKATEHKKQQRMRKRDLQVSRPAPRGDVLTNRSSALTTFIPPEPPALRAEQGDEHYQVLQPDNREMRILIRNDSGWVDARRCRRRSIIEGIDEAGYFLVSEFLPIPLQHFCKAPIYPTEPQLSSILHQVLTGIDFLLGSGLVHEQVSAANLLVSYDGKIKICDVERYSSGGNVSKLLESFTRLMMKLMDKEKLEDAVAGLTRPDRWSHEAIYMFTEAVSKPPVKQLLEHPFLRKREQGVFEWLVYFVLQSAPSS
ncbi:putative transporter [Verticillium dahliae VDG2]|nr:putative transporter [Verticillium dahliae VDG2]